MTYQYKMEVPSSPFIHSFLTVLRYVKLDLFLGHERRKDSLIDRIVWQLKDLENNGKKQHWPDIPSTIKTLMGGTTFPSAKSLLFFCGAGGGALLSAGSRLFWAFRGLIAPDAPGELASNGPVGEPASEGLIRRAIACAESSEIVSLLVLAPGDEAADVPRRISVSKIIEGLGDCETLCKEENE